MLERALELTRELCACVEAAEWDAAADLESERRALLEEYFAAPPPAAEVERAVATLRELVALNDRLVGVAEHLQRALAREADTLLAGRRAARAYLSVAV